jgi:hypothetical protein
MWKKELVARQRYSTCVRLLVAVVSETIVLASRNSVAVYITRVNNFVDCGFVAPYYKILTLTHIHIVCCFAWLLCKSAKVSIAAGNTAERYFQEGPIQLPLWQ